MYPSFSLFDSPSLPFGSSSSFYQGNISGSSGVSRDGSFARGFCKNGSSYKFVHSDDFEGSMSALSGSSSSFDAAEKMMRLKLAHQQR
ncbi:hypothetical protein CRG98_005195 [Punica granatum]|uniref:Uncharacterized protein n=1 Tax=Punica granatum TaxID=22663 RepID=A0A2I0L145_PUNGR|nr:hypothetical protein CRG98_005195 [Punica granatum]